MTEQEAIDSARHISGVTNIACFTHTLTGKSGSKIFIYDQTFEFSTESHISSFIGAVAMTMNKWTVTIKSYKFLRHLPCNEIQGCAIDKRHRKRTWDVSVQTPNGATTSADSVKIFRINGRHIF